MSPTCIPSWSWTFPRPLLLSLFCVVLLLPSLAPAGERKTRILLIGKDRDHPFQTHEYMAECSLLAKCLRQTPGVETIVSNGWPREADKIKNIDAIVLYTRNGGNVLDDPLVRSQTHAFLKKGVGLTAIHWSTGAVDKAGDFWLNTVGGWFNTKFSKLNTTKTTLKQLAPQHPICQGWSEYQLRDEYYLDLKYLPTATPVLGVRLGNKDHTVGWVFERPDKGRSFGFVCGHFHDNFGIEAFRKPIVNGVLWTAHRQVPKIGAPVVITADDMKLPPDPRAKKSNKKKQP